MKSPWLTFFLCSALPAGGESFSRDEALEDPSELLWTCAVQWSCSSPLSVRLPPLLLLRVIQICSTSWLAPSWLRLSCLELTLFFFLNTRRETPTVRRTRRMARRMTKRMTRRMTRRTTRRTARG